MNTPANDYRPGYAVAVAAYLFAASAIMMPAIAVVLVIVLLLLMRFKARGNNFLSSHLKALAVVGVVIMAFNMASTFGLKYVGIIDVSASMQNPSSLIDEALFQQWMPYISISFFLYLGWTGARILTGMKLLRKGHAVKKTRFAGAILKSA